MATYTLKGSRFIRRYDAPVRTPVYSAASDAAQIAAELCNCPWVEVGTAASVFPAHTDKALDSNLDTRDLFDAANFCTHHVNGMHLAHANVACYKFALPPAAVGLTLTSLTARISCDPYCRDGARIAIHTNSTGVIPTACEDCRTGLAHAERVAPRTVSADGSIWYGATADAVITPSSPIQLGSYLYVFVTLETPSYSRDAWLEGAAKAINSIEVTLSAAITGIAPGSSIDCSHESREYNICRGGVLPELPADSHPVKFVTLQTSGDDLPKSSISVNSDDAPPGLYIYEDSALKTLIESLPPGSIYNICTLGQTYNDPYGITYNYTCICGSFSGGSISGLDGLYIYDHVRHKLLEIDSTGIASSQLANLATTHGGLAAAYLVPVRTPGNLSVSSIGYSMLLGLYAVARDGSYLSYSGPNLGTAITASQKKYLSILYHLTVASFDDGIHYIYRAYDVVNFTSTSSNISFTDVNIRPVDYPQDIIYNETTPGSPSPITVNYRVHAYTFHLYGYSESFVYAGTGDPKAQNNIGHMCCRVGSAYFFGLGDSINVAGTSYSSCIKANSQGVITDAAVLAAAITPNSWAGFSVSPVYDFSQFKNPEYIAISGAFNSVNDLGCNGFAIVKVSDGSTAISHAGISALRAGGQLDKFIVSNNGVVMASYRRGGGTTYDPPDAEHAHTDTTNEQSCIGLRSVFARFYTGKTVDAVTSGFARPGAAFCVRLGALELDTTDGSRTVPTWQIAASALVVPFACPTDYAASRIRLDWSGIDATSGSAIRVWLKRGDYLDHYPDISSPDLWQSDAADGWEHVGTIDATTEDTSATFDIDPLRCRVATLLITAYVSMDAVNPDDDTDSPQGVGTLAVNPITGAVTGSEFIPDITLIG